MDDSSKSNNEIVFIDLNSYDDAYSEWVLRIYGKAMDDVKLMKKFDISIGLELTDETDIVDIDSLSFLIVDKRKFLVAKLKYGF